MVEEDAASDTVIGGLVVQPLLVPGVAELRRVGGHVAKDRPVVVALLRVLVALRDAQRLRKVRSNAELFVFLRVLEPNDLVFLVLDRGLLTHGHARVDIVALAIQN